MNYSISQEAVEMDLRSRFCYIENVEYEQLNQHADLFTKLIHYHSYGNKTGEYKIIMTFLYRAGGKETKVLRCKINPIPEERECIIFDRISLEYVLTIEAIKI